MVCLPLENGAGEVCGNNLFITLGVFERKISSSCGNPYPHQLGNIHLLLVSKLRVNGRKVQGCFALYKAFPG